MAIPTELRLLNLLPRAIIGDARLTQGALGSLNLASTVMMLVLILLLSRADLLTCQEAGQDLESLFRAGQAALRDGDYQRAERSFKQVLALDPSLVEAEVNLGLAYQSLLDYTAAARTLSHALRTRPNLPDVNVIVGMDYLKLGSPDRSLPFLDRALKLDPANRDAHEAMALYHLSQGNVQGAAQQYRRVADLTPDKPEALFRLGHEYIELAARLAYQGARLYPDSAWGHRFLGDMLSERGRWEDAAREYRKALSIDPRQPGTHTLLGEALLRDGKLDDAETEFREELQLDSLCEEALLGLANVQLAAARPLEALASVNRVWNSSPQFLLMYLDYSLAPQVLPTAQDSIVRLTDQPDGPAKHFLLSALYASREKGNESDQETQAFQRYFTSRRNGSQTSIGPASCKLRLYAQCVTWLEGAHPKSPSSYLLLGKTYFTMRKYDRAADALAHVHGEKLANSEASYWSERSYQALAAAAYAQLEASFPDSWRTHQLRAESFTLRQQRNDAIKEYEAALRLRPDDPELHEALGEFYLDNHSDEDALRELEKAAALDGSRTKTLYLLGRLYVVGDEDEKAIPLLRRALQLQPNLNEAGGLLGTAYVRMGKFSEAVPWLEKAAPLDHFGNIHYQLYQAYRRLGEPELAKKALARSQEIRQGSLEHDQAVIMGSPPREPESQ